jgi:hypothetical protein
MVLEPGGSDQPSIPDDPMPAMPAPAKPRAFPIEVFLSGLVTSAITLFLVYLVRRSTSLDPMGLFVYRLCPLGAILVGACAGSGYGVRSIRSGLKCGTPFQMTCIGLLAVTFFAAHYAEFVSRGSLIARDGHALGFWEYFDLSARGMTWAGRPSEPMGAEGYLYVSVGFAGFVIGGFLSSAAALGLPYCSHCRRYLKSVNVRSVEAGVASQRLLKGGAMADREHRAVLEGAVVWAQGLRTAIAQNDLARFLGSLGAGPSPMAGATMKPRLLQVRFVRCPSCYSGQIRVLVLTGGGMRPVVEKVYISEVPREWIVAAEHALSQAKL